MENLEVFSSFFTIALTNNTAAIYKSYDYKLSHGKNSMTWGRKCLAVHYLVSSSSSSQILHLISGKILLRLHSKNAIW